MNNFLTQRISTVSNSSPIIWHACLMKGYTSAMRKLRSALVSVKVEETKTRTVLEKRCFYKIPMVSTRGCMVGENKSKRGGKKSRERIYYRKRVKRERELASYIRGPVAFQHIKIFIFRNLCSWLFRKLLRCSKD